MDIIAFQNRLEELEMGMKELRVDYELDQNIGFKLEELRDKLEVVTKDRDFFRQMSMKAQGKRDELNSARLDLIIKANIFFNEENYENLKKNFEYQKINKELERCQQEIDIGARFRIQLNTEKNKIMMQIEKLEYREMQYKYKAFN